MPVLPTLALFIGLAAIVGGAVILVRRSVAWFRRHGRIVPTFAGLGALGMAAALLLAAVGLANALIARLEHE